MRISLITVVDHVDMDVVIWCVAKYIVEEEDLPLLIPLSMVMRRGRERMLNDPNISRGLRWAYYLQDEDQLPKSYITCNAHISKQYIFTTMNVRDDIFMAIYHVTVTIKTKDEGARYTFNLIVEGERTMPKQTITIEFTDSEDTVIDYIDPEFEFTKEIPSLVEVTGHVTVDITDVWRSLTDRTKKIVMTYTYIEAKAKISLSDAFPSNKKLKTYVRLTPALDALKPPPLSRRLIVKM